MANSEEKVRQFMQAIQRYAEEQSRRIREEVRQFKQDNLARAEQQALTEAAALTEREQAAVREEMSREMSQRDMAARRELLSVRAGIMDKTFALAREKILAYTRTDAYPQALQESLDRLMALLPAEGTVYRLGKADSALLPPLADRLPQGSRIELSDDITLGGLRGENRAAGLMADDTLDARLDAQTEWFEARSGLTVSF